MGTKWERWAPATGILFVIAFFAAFFIAGEPPAADAGSAAVRDYYADDGAILTATYVYGIGLVLYLWFIGVVAHRLREDGQPRLAAVAFAGGILTAALAMGQTIMNAAMAYRTPADDGVLQAFYDVQLVTESVVAFPAATFLLGVAIAASRTGTFARWLNGLAGLGALLILVGGAAFASDGLFAPRGGWALIGTLAFMLWTVIASAMLTMQAREAEAPRPAAAPV